MRRLWIGRVVAVAAVAALAGGAWAWLRPGDPLARGRAAYARGDWPAALDAARDRLRDRRDDRDALRLAARSSARLGRDDAARALYRRLGDDGTQGEDD